MLASMFKPGIVAPEVFITPLDWTLECLRTIVRIFHMPTKIPTSVLACKLYPTLAARYNGERARGGCWRLRAAGTWAQLGDGNMCARIGTWQAVTNMEVVIWGLIKG
jgi:hypothetical protein